MEGGRKNTRQVTDIIHNHFTHSGKNLVGHGKVGGWPLWGKNNISLSHEGRTAALYYTRTATVAERRSPPHSTLSPASQGKARRCVVTGQNYSSRRGFLAFHTSAPAGVGLVGWVGYAPFLA